MFDWTNSDNNSHNLYKYLFLVQIFCCAEVKIFSRLEVPSLGLCVMINKTGRKNSSFAGCGVPTLTSSLIDHQTIYDPHKSESRAYTDGHLSLLVMIRDPTADLICDAADGSFRSRGVIIFGH